MKFSLLAHFDGFYSTYSGFYVKVKFVLKKHFFFSKICLTCSLFFKVMIIRDSSLIGLSILPHVLQQIGDNLKIESRRAILVDPNCAYKSAGHVVALTTFEVNLWQVRNFHLHIGCKIDGRKSIRISRWYLHWFGRYQEKREEAKKSPPVGRGLTLALVGGVGWPPMVFRE